MCHQYKHFVTNITLTENFSLFSYFQPLFAFLNEKYSAKGALLIFAGITFHSCIGGLFLKPFPKKIQRQSTVANAPNGNLFQERSVRLLSKLTVTIRAGKKLPRILKSYN